MARLREAIRQARAAAGPDAALRVLETDPLSRVPERRAVLVLSRYNDLEYDDIARVLDCTPAAARVRAHRALNELREIYRELERRQHNVR